MANKHIDKIKEIDQKFVLEGAKKIRKRDYEYVLKHEEKIIEKFDKKDGSLEKYKENAYQLFYLIKYYMAGDYTDIAKKAINIVVFGLKYIHAQRDLIPDNVPVLGLLDDSLVFGLCIYMVEDDIADFKQWLIDNNLYDFDNYKPGVFNP